jgi:hypothetical protein
VDWQQIIALGIVGLTAAVFVRNGWRRRRQPVWMRERGCDGCGAMADARPLPAVRLHAVKGGRPELSLLPPGSRSSAPGLGSSPVGASDERKGRGGSTRETARSHQDT